MPASGICNEIRLTEDGPLVECSTAVLESIRRQAVEGFNAFGHGGLETGGVLYGYREEGRFNIVAFAELTCEHALGPGFVLSERDRTALADLLQAPPGMETLGWYRVHTRSGLVLDADDRRLFERFPADAGCAALIVKPTAWGPANAAFFLREPDGRIVPPAAREFLLKPVLQGAQPGTAQPEAAELPATDPPAPEPQLADREIDRAPSCDGPPWEAEPDRISEPPVFTAVSSPDAAEARPRALRLSWKFYSAAALCVLLALIVWPRSPRNLALAVYSVAAGQVRIEWNRGSAPVLQARSGTLVISDGTYSRVIPLDPAQLRSTSITYSLQTDHISVSLRVQDPGNSATVEEAVQYVGQPAPSPQPVQRVAVHDAPPPAAKEITRAPAEEQTRELRTAERRTPSSSSDAPRAPIVRTAPAREAPPAALPAPPLISNRTVAAVPEVLPSVLSDLLTSARTLPRPAPASPIPAAPAASAPSYSGPRSGRMIWTGVLTRRGVVEIEVNHSNTGSLAGALPGVPVSIRVSPSEFGRNGLIVFTSDAAKAGHREPPGAANGWNAVEFQKDPERERGILILEAPNRANDYGRLVLRSDLRNCAVILIEWTVVQ